ncbi:hypothetical protein PT2222_140061 [Paraburkholderia tropica]
MDSSFVYVYCWFSAFFNKFYLNYLYNRYPAGIGSRFTQRLSYLWILFWGRASRVSAL